MDLRSRGLSFRKISSTLKEDYGISISHMSVRAYLTAIPEKPTEEAHVKDEKIAVEVKPPEQVQAATKEVVEAQPIVEMKQEPVNKAVPRDLNEEYHKYWEEARRKENLRRERDADIIAYDFVPLALGGLILLMMWFNHWII